MNTPNKLTLLRICLVPVFLLFLMVDDIPHNYLFALIIFVGASITDAIDGNLARKNNQITDFGKFLDPLADKVLVISALVSFCYFGFANPIAVIIIIAREFMVTSIRLVVATSDGTVISANKAGKIKTVIQMVAIITILLMLTLNVYLPLEEWLAQVNISIYFVANMLIWISAFVTLYSGMIYLIQNKSAINTAK